MTILYNSNRGVGMHQVLLLGAGKIGSAVAKFLSRSGGYDVLVGDIDEQALGRVRQSAGVETIKINSSDPQDLAGAMKGRQCVLSALNYSFNPGVAEAALKAGVSYFDLTE